MLFRGRAVLAATGAVGAPDLGSAAIPATRENVRPSSGNLWHAGSGTGCASAAASPFRMVVHQAIRIPHNHAGLASPGPGFPGDGGLDREPIFHTGGFAGRLRGCQHRHQGMRSAPSISGTQVIAIQTRSPGLADSSWPSWRHDNRGTAWLVPGTAGSTTPADAAVFDGIDVPVDSRDSD